MTTQPLVEYAAVSNLPATSVDVSEHEGQRSGGMVRWGFILMFVGVGMGAIGRKLMHEEIVTVIGILLSLLGMFLTAYPFLLPPPRRKHITSPLSQPVVLAPSQPARHLPQGNSSAYLPSVTEGTTDLLKGSPVTIPRRNRYQDD